MKLLLIEDNNGHVALVRRALSKATNEFHIDQVGTMTEGIRMLANASFDAILLDMSLPDGEGPENIRRLEAADAETPIVVLTTLDDNRTALKSLENGAQDYLVKDKIGADVLIRALLHAVKRHEVVVENRRLVDRLRQAERQLQNNNQRLLRLYETAQQFVDNVSHEFRTPLTVIKEYGALIREGIVGSVNDEQGRLLAVIEDRANDLNSIVDDMLDVSKLEAGMMGVSRDFCKLSDIVDHILPSLERKAAIKSVELTVDLPDDLPDVYCDGEKAGRVITNLVINGINYCQASGSVKLSAAADTASGDVCVSVSDNGPGIDRSKLEEIFVRFRQLEVNVRRSCRGFGLGLNIAKELVGLNFGVMHVESELGVGSVFSFTLPIGDPLEVTERYANSLVETRAEADIAILAVALPESIDTVDADDVHLFLHGVLGANDLLFRLHERRWILLVSVSAVELPRFVDRVANARLELNRNRPFGELPDVKLQKLACFPAVEREAVVTAVRRLHGDVSRLRLVPPSLSVSKGTNAEERGASAERVVDDAATTSVH